MLESGASIDDVLGVMRREGLWQAESIRLLTELTKLSLREAKEAVHTSSVWADLRQDTENFHERLEATAKESLKNGSEN
jgi:hypothetical protein